MEPWTRADSYTAIMQLLDDAEHARSELDSLWATTEARTMLQRLRDEELLRAVDTTSQAEVARRLEVSREAISQQVTHARRRLLHADPIDTDAGSRPDRGGS